MKYIENIYIFIIFFSWIFYSYSIITGKFNKNNLLVYTSFIIHFSWIIYRTIITRHVPFSNAYESLIFFSFLLFIKSFIISKYLNKKAKILVLIPGQIFLFLSFMLPENLKPPTLLSPALQSFWIFIHVPSIFFGYVSLTFTFIIFLIIIILKKNLFDILNEELKQSFFFISLGIITGAFWAEYSWSIFWSWDSKEIWALVTWLFIGLVFHVRSNKMKFIFIAFAFFSMLFTYFGVMFLLPSLHSYIK